jgi:hypothetical protein
MAVPLCTFRVCCDAVWPRGAQRVHLAENVCESVEDFTRVLRNIQSVGDLERILKSTTITSYMRDNQEIQRAYPPLVATRSFFLIKYGSLVPLDVSLGSLTLNALVQDHMLSQGLRMNLLSRMYLQEDAIPQDRSVLEKTVHVFHPSTPMVPGETLTFTVDIDIRTKEEAFRLPEVIRSTPDTVGSPTRMRLDLVLSTMNYHMPSYGAIQAARQYMEHCLYDLCLPRPVPFTPRTMVDIVERNQTLFAFQPPMAHHPLLMSGQLRDLGMMRLFETVPMVQRLWFRVSFQLWYNVILNILAHAPPMDFSSGGLLCSPSGTGKTRTMCALLEDGLPTLIVTRQMCVAQWEEDLRLLGLSYAVYLRHDHRGLDQVVRDYAIVITSYDLVESTVYPDRIRVDRVVFDEAHHIKTTQVPSLRAVPAVRRWVLSSTPLGLPPHYTTAMNALYALCALPDPRHDVFDRGSVRPVLLEKMGDRDIPLRLLAYVGTMVVSHIEPRDVQSERVTLRLSECPLVYQAYQTAAQDLLTGSMPARTFEDHFERLCRQLSDPATPHEPIPTVPAAEARAIVLDDVCGICLSEFREPTRLPCGKHFLCFSCVMEMTNRGAQRCPYCREPFLMTDLRLLHPPQRQAHTPKLTHLLSILESLGQEKAIIVTRFRATAASVTTFLTLHGVEAGVLSHRASRRVEDFRRSLVPEVLVVTLRHVSTGVPLSSLSLVVCRTIILMEPVLNTDDEDLVASLVAPIPVRLIRLVYDDTVERRLDLVHRGQDIDLPVSYIHNAMIMRRLLTQPPSQP